MNELPPEVEEVARVVVAVACARRPALARRSEDLLQVLRVEGWVACRRHDPARASLRTFLNHRLRGAILDALRADPTDIGAGGASMDARAGRLDQRFLGAASIDFAREGSRDSPLEPGAEDRAFDAIDARDEVAHLARLDPRGAELALAWLAGNDMRSIGRAAGLSESRVSQICTRFFKRVGAAPPSTRNYAPRSAQATRRVRARARIPRPCGCLGWAAHRKTCPLRAKKESS